MQQPERNPQEWVTATCGFCGCKSECFIADCVHYERRLGSGKTCWTQIVCQSCLSVSIVQMNPHGVEWAVKELGAKVTLLPSDCPNPTSVRRLKPIVDITMDDVLDFMTVIRTYEDSALYDAITGAEPA